MTGVVKNLNVEGYVACSEYAGGIAAYCEGTIENCTFRGLVKAKKEINKGRRPETGAHIPSFGYAGGISAVTAGTIRNCINYADVIAYNFAGGIAGASAEMTIQEDVLTTVTIENCMNFGSVWVEAMYDDTFCGAGILSAVDVYHENPALKCTVKGCVNYGTIFSPGTGIVDGNFCPQIFGTNPELLGESGSFVYSDCVTNGLYRNNRRVNQFGELFKYNVTLHSNNGKDKTETIESFVNGRDSLPKVRDTKFSPPSLDSNYGFLGWNTKPDGSGRYYMPDGGEIIGDGIPGDAYGSLVVDSNVDLYAIWAQWKYVDFYDRNGERKREQAWKLRTDLTSLPSGRFLIDTDNSTVLNYSDRLEIRGDVNLICSGNAEFSSGISVPPGFSLSVYASGSDSNKGKITANADSNGYAGIGGDAGKWNKGISCGTITIYGGEVEARGAENGAGIGGGNGEKGGFVIVNGGSVDATGGINGAGIGGGNGEKGGYVTVNGGSVQASGGNYGAGIGGGNGGSGGCLAVNGGSVQAAGGGNGAARIGKGYEGADHGALIFGDKIMVFEADNRPVDCNNREENCRAPYPIRNKITGCVEHSFSGTACRYCGYEVSNEKYFSGSGSEEDPYLINSEVDWNNLAELVRWNSSGTVGKYYKLTRNISVKTMVGYDERHAFKGNFDGGFEIDEGSGARTLTVNFDSDSPYCAPFRYTDGAMIKNLKVTGSIRGGNHSAGLVGCPVSTYLKIENCLVNVELYGTGVGCRLGGVIGKGFSRISLEGVVFSGKLLNTEDAGTFWCGDSDEDQFIMELNNCLDLSRSGYKIGIGGNIKEENIVKTYYLKAIGTPGIGITCLPSRLSASNPITALNYLF